MREGSLLSQNFTFSTVDSKHKPYTKDLKHSSSLGEIRAIKSWVIFWEVIGKNLEYLNLEQREAIYSKILAHNQWPWKMETQHYTSSATETTNFLQQLGVNLEAKLEAFWFTTQNFWMWYSIEQATADNLLQIINEHCPSQTTLVFLK